MAGERCLWVVEVRFSGARKWMSTCGVGLGRDAARNNLREWRSRMPDDSLRLVRYVPQRKHHAG